MKSIAIAWLLALSALVAVGCSKDKPQGRDLSPDDFAGKKGAAPTTRPALVRDLSPHPYADTTSGLNQPSPKPLRSAPAPSPRPSPPVPVDHETPSVPVSTERTPPPAENTVAPERTAPRDATDAEAQRVLGNLPRPAIVAAPSATQPASLLVDGMVGQVNGQPIYASQVFDPVDEQLKRLGNPGPGVVVNFPREAAKIIAGRLKEIVTRSLILGEAERDLNEQEQMGLKALMRQRREELLRQYGSGSPIVADTALREKSGKGLDETLKDFRQTLLVRRYLSQKLFPKINITRKDIERYYREHQEEFNPKPGRTIRLIRVSEDAPSRADRVDEALKDKPFAEVAATPALNSFKPSEAGLIAEKSTDFKFSDDELNAALGKLKAGEASPRVRSRGAFWWVYVESVETGESKSLVDVQREIEERIRQQRYLQLQDRYIERLFETGTYNPLDQMVMSLVEIAIARYGRPQG